MQAAKRPEEEPDNLFGRKPGAAERFDNSIQTSQFQ
jgi:hypothetical protein